MTLSRAQKKARHEQKRKAKRKAIFIAVQREKRLEQVPEEYRPKRVENLITS